MDDQKQSRATWPVALNALFIALLAAAIEQVFHESVHGLTSLAVGGRWEVLNFWFAETGAAAGAPEWHTFLLKGGAAIANVLVGLACMMLFRARVARDRPLLRLFLMYSAAYHAMAGFGYLAFDPMFANADSLGDWAHITMMLGGGWEVRIPIILVGGAGTVWVFFWIGRAALRMVASGAMSERRGRTRSGLVTLIVPYVMVNLVFTVLALFNALGTAATILSIIKVWFGFIGLFWGFFIVFMWSPYRGPFGDETSLPHRLAVPWIVASVALLAVCAAVLLPGLTIQGR